MLLVERKEPKTMYPSNLLITLTERLCAPDLAGRRVGTEGHARASAFLAERFRQFGWNDGRGSNPLTPINKKARIRDSIDLRTIESIPKDGEISAKNDGYPFNGLLRLCLDRG